MDGAQGGEELLGPLFAAHRRCFDAHVALLDPPAERVAIPYEGGTLPGYLFVPAADGRARPTLIFEQRERRAGDRASPEPGLVT